jgi:hypothetical protein
MQRRRRDGCAERLWGLQVDDQLDLGSLLHRQIGRLLTLENPAGIDAKLTTRLRLRTSGMAVWGLGVGQEKAGCDQLFCVLHGRFGQQS